MHNDLETEVTQSSSNVYKHVFVKNIAQIEKFASFICKNSTHEKGNILNLLLSSIADDSVLAVAVKLAGVSDHSLVSCKLLIWHENLCTEYFNYRNIKTLWRLSKMDCAVHDFMIAV